MSISFTFNAKQGLIIISARIEGPTGHTYAQLALDTGATSTVINVAKIVSIGYDPAVVPVRVPVTTGSGVEFVPRLAVDRIEALGKVHTNFPLICHTLPPTAPVDGVLGLDFLRGQRLTINFRKGRITLT
ncbi:retroviral-like aspartic protease family protein [Candidatus Poribacteria bacterium]|nr:retroviral-like aspartic protease family protein [Candidatus Poribacteria bacterium]